VLHNTYHGQRCSIARTLEVIGERWTILIVRDAFRGVRRFDDFQRSLGVARNVLQTRLQRLVEAGVLDRRRYQERPERFEYVLTEAGRDLWPIVVALLGWGDRHRMAVDGPPVVIRHAGCGGEVESQPTCTACGEQVGIGAVRVQDRTAAGAA
jgi:DNA-binding HxlR family transcriptional regulator